MEETEKVVLRLEPLDDDNAQLTVTGPTEVVALVMFAVTSLLADESEDCGDPDCPVHGEGADDSSESIAETV